MLIGLLKHRLARGSLLSIFNQGIVSLSNFLTSILIAQAITPNEFGSYSLLFAGIIFLSGFQNSLITGPLRVLGVRATNAIDGEYFRAQLYLQILLVVILTLVSVVFLYLVLNISNSKLIFSFAVCLFMYQLHELFRVINLTKFALSQLIVMDVLNHVLRIGFLIILKVHNILTPAIALSVIAISCCIGAATCFKKNFIVFGSLPFLKDSLIANWNYGKWLLLETVAYTASTQIYLYMTALIVDKQTAGAFYAVQNILNMANVFLLGMMNYAIPVGRQKLIETGYKAWQKWLFQIGIVLAVMTLLVVLPISIIAKPILNYLYTPFYGQYAFLVPILSVSVMLRAVNTVLQAAFNTAGFPQVGFAAKLASGLFTILIFYPLLRLWGVAGAAVGVVFTQVIWTIVYLTYIMKNYLREERVLARLSKTLP